MTTEREEAVRALLSSLVAEEMAVLELMGRHTREWVAAVARYDKLLDAGRWADAFDLLVKRRGGK